jgi:hypothetical protein
VLNYQELAARRYREYQWQKRKDQVNLEIVAIAVDLGRRIFPLMKKFGLVDNRPIENIKVE